MKETKPAFRRAGKEDFQGIADLLGQRYQGTNPLALLEWKFLKCPDGQGQILIAENHDGRIVGMMAYLPRRFASEGTGSFCLMQGVDAVVPKAMREKGIYSGITSLARREMDVPKIAFPNELSIGFGVKFGWQVLATLRVWRFPVALGPALSKTPFPFLAPLANAFSRLYTTCLLGPLPRDLRLEPVSRFEKDYVGKGDRVEGIRTADYLNWRFIDNPIHTYSAYEFFQEEERIGYCVYAKQASSAEVFDFIATRRRRECLRMMVEQNRREQISHLRFRGIHLRVGRFGFLPGRSHGKCIVFKAPQGKWMITMCDTDW